MAFHAIQLDCSALNFHIKSQALTHFIIYSSGLTLSSLGNPWSPLSEEMHSLQPPAKASYTPQIAFLWINGGQSCCPRHGCRLSGETGGPVIDSETLSLSLWSPSGRASGVSTWVADACGRIKRLVQGAPLERWELNDSPVRGSL